MTTTTRAPSAPPLDGELERLLRRMRLPYIRRAAPELLARAKAQRWDPGEVLKALLVEEVSGRDRSALATRRARAGFPTGKTFAAWDPAMSSIPAPTQSALRTLEWICVDDIGLLAVGADAAEGLYRLVDAAPVGFDELMPKTLATATVDNRSRSRFRSSFHAGVGAFRQLSGCARGW
ncbi:MAG TPA: hypothetical protein VMU34_14705, partial [Mycobacterium sp.]|nr:hypothetical protein [Mycobacterium sp.]